MFLWSVKMKGPALSFLVHFGLKSTLSDFRIGSLFVSLYNLIGIFFLIFSLFKYWTVFMILLGYLCLLTSIWGLFLSFKVIQIFLHVFPKLIDFFDHYIIFFSIPYPEILSREYFYRTRGLLGKTGYLGFSYCLCFCEETWVYGFIKLGMYLIWDYILSLLCVYLILFLLLPEFCWFEFIEEASACQSFKYSVLFFFRFIIYTVICLHYRRGFQVSL